MKNKKLMILGTLFIVALVAGSFYFSGGEILQGRLALKPATKVVELTKGVRSPATTNDVKTSKTIPKSYISQNTAKSETPAVAPKLVVSDDTDYGYYPENIIAGDTNVPFFGFKVKAENHDVTITEIKSNLKFYVGNTIYDPNKYIKSFVVYDKTKNTNVSQSYTIDTSGNLVVKSNYKIPAGEERVLAFKAWFKDLNSASEEEYLDNLYTYPTLQASTGLTAVADNGEVKIDFQGKSWIGPGHAAHLYESGSLKVAAMQTVNSGKVIEVHENQEDVLIADYILTAWGEDWDLDLISFIVDNDGNFDQGDSSAVKGLKTTKVEFYKGNLHIDNDIVQYNLLPPSFSFSGSPHGAVQVYRAGDQLRVKVFAQIESTWNQGEELFGTEFRTPMVDIYAIGRTSGKLLHLVDGDDKLTEIWGGDTLPIFKVVESD